MLNAGTVVDGRYEILENIGEGAYGSVFKAQDLELGRLVAIKLLHRTAAGEPRAIMRFEQESRILSKLSHPNLVSCYKCGLWNNHRFIAMEYVDGVSLRELINRQGKCSVEQALEIAIAITSGMQEAHNHNIVHRDLKPNNVMLARTADGVSVKILDFGLARLAEKAPGTDTLTQTGELMGSLHYMSPEQCLGQTVDCRSDIYALGCILHEMLSGCPPFQHDSPLILIQKHIVERPSFLSVESDDEHLCRQLNDILQKSLAKHPAERHATMKTFMVELEKLKQTCSGNVQARVVSRRDFCAIRRALAACLLGLAIPVIAAASLGFYWLLRTKPIDPTGAQLESQSELVKATLLSHDTYRLRKRFIEAAPERREPIGRILIDNLRKRCWTARDRGEFEQCRQFVEEALEIAKLIDNKTEFARICVDLGAVQRAWLRTIPLEQRKALALVELHRLEALIKDVQEQMRDPVYLDFLSEKAIICSDSGHFNRLRGIVDQVLPIVTKLHTDPISSRSRDLCALTLNIAKTAQPQTAEECGQVCDILLDLFEFELNRSEVTGATPARELRTVFERVHKLLDSQQHRECEKQTDTPSAHRERRFRKLAAKTGLRFDDGSQ